jgi:hypothetical protein
VTSLRRVRWKLRHQLSGWSSQRVRQALQFRIAAVRLPAGAEDGLRDQLAAATRHPVRDSRRARQGRCGAREDRRRHPLLIFTLTAAAASRGAVAARRARLQAAIAKALGMTRGQVETVRHRYGIAGLAGGPSARSPAAASPRSWRAGLRDSVALRAGDRLASTSAPRCWPPRRLAASACVPRERPIEALRHD